MVRGDKAVPDGTSGTSAERDGNFGTGTLGSAEHPTGITMYDKSTGTPYCFQIDNGSATTTPGACTDILPAASQTTSQTTSTDVGSYDLPTSPAIPTISINGLNPAHLAIGSTFGDLGAIITGPTEGDKNLGLRIFVDGRELSPVETAQIDTSAPGEHTIDYVATNAAGTATSTRTVIIDAPLNMAVVNSVATSTDTTVADSAPLTP